mmetsp:Transcript_37328/g.36927  ORF Transcript_37328/g.36927 Transcript_37328/m.36927 type:complete len:95 (+) Transcript_37328:3-287(+)
MIALDKESSDLKEKSDTIERNLHLRPHELSLDQQFEDNKIEINSSKIGVDSYQNLDNPLAESSLHTSSRAQETTQDIIQIIPSTYSLIIPSKGL